MEFDIKGFWRDVLTQNREALPAWFAPGAQVLWHCTNERFRLEEFIRANCDYPGDWDGPPPPWRQEMRIGGNIQ